MNSICKKRVRLLDGFVYGLIYFCAALSVFLIAGIVLYVIAKGFDKVNWEFLTTTTEYRKEFVKYHKITQKLKISSYFCKMFFHFIIICY